MIILSILESKLLRRRAECFPPIPHQLSDVVIAGEWACTWDDRRHLPCLDNNWGMAVFLTDDNARRPMLRRCDQIFIGGTFRTATHPYRQLVTIHGFFRDTVVPLCFCLLSGKTVGHYRQLLLHVRRKLRQLGHRTWHSQNVICDFEVALITAIHTELPRTRVRGCYFHFSQALWRQVSSLGIVTAYSSNSRSGRRLRKIVQKIMSVGFLPTPVIARTFQVTLC